MAEEGYCVDSSSLIKLKQDFPRGTFPTVWEKVEELIDGGRLFAPSEVFEEIKKDDVLGPWCKQRRKALFKPLDQRMLQAAKKVEARFPQLAKPGRFGPSADPFVVALAMVEKQGDPGSLVPSQRGCLVVTEEGGGTQQIPAASKAFGLEAISLVALFQKEGWVFR